MLCKTDETGTEFFRTFFTFTLSFRISEDCITFRNDILDHEISVIFTADCLNGKRDRKCRLLFTLLTMLSLMTLSYVKLVCFVSRRRIFVYTKRFFISWRRLFVSQGRLLVPRRTFFVSQSIETILKSVYITPLTCFSMPNRPTFWKI